MLEAACREGAMKQFLNVPSGMKTAHQKGIVLLRPMFGFLVHLFSLSISQEPQVSFPPEMEMRFLQPNPLFCYNKAVIK